MSFDFNAFKCYQDLLGATDEQLCLLLARGCTDAPLVSYQDAFTALLVRVFGLATGIPWVRAYEQGHRPDEAATGVHDGQYGTIHMLSFEQAMSEPLRTWELPENEQDICECIALHGKYTFQLDVYRDAGAAVRCPQGEAVQRPTGSAIDVLMRLLLRMQFNIFRDALQERCIQYGSRPIQGIQNIPELVKETWESRATANLELFASPSTSMQLPAASNYCEIPLELCAPDDVPVPEPTVCKKRAYDCKE